MNQPQRKPHPEPAPTPLRINIEGDPATVAALLAAMVGALGGQAQGPAGEQAEPEAMLISRTEAARRTGKSLQALSALVRAGKLRNHGTEARMLFSPADLRGLIEEGP